jgi:hypothetical protein
LIGRAQAALPGRKPPAKNSAVKGVVSSLGSAKSSALARKPSKKGIVGMLAGGLGVAAMTKRRRGANQDDMPTTPPLQPVKASGEEPNSMAGQTDAETQRPIGQGGIMEIPKEQILQMLRDRGNHDQAQQADQQLPDQVDPEQHAGLLGQIGIDPGEILGGAGGKLGL